MPSESRYKVPSIEKFLNRVISFIFYFRLLFVVLALAIIICIADYSYTHSLKSESLKNFALILTCGSIIIGIFYSIINYEHNQIKFKHDVQTAKEILTFNTAAKMYDQEMILRFRNLKDFFENNKSLFLGNNGYEIDQLFKKNFEQRACFVVIFNYFEAISLGVKQCIMDEKFMKRFFHSIFLNYIKNYGTYLEYIQRESPNFCHFTELAIRWKKEN